jgi:predicted metal-dependent HD superfamily phosphohydrolase
MIEATATHRVPDLGDPGANRDAALFLDMDLAILGAPPAAFDAYEEAVRREYAWVDDAAWRTGRAAVLRTFLERPHVFHTPEFRERFEDRARENMARSLGRLANPSLP